MEKSGRIYLQNTYLLKNRYAEYIKNAQNSMIRKQCRKKKNGPEIYTSEKNVYV